MMRSRLLLLLQAGASDTCLNKSCGDHVSFPVRAEVCGYRGQIKEVTCSLWNNGGKMCLLQEQKYHQRILHYM